jgi:phage gp16-like protein
LTQKQELEAQKEQERRQMQSLFIKVAQEKVRADDQNHLLNLLNAEDSRLQ